MRMPIIGIAITAPSRMRLLLALVASICCCLSAVVGGDASDPTAIKLGRNPTPDSGVRPPAPEWTTRDPYAPGIPGTAFTSMTRVSDAYRIYHNLWFHNQRWYALLPADNVEDVSLEVGLSPNNEAIRMAITDMANFTKKLRVRVHVAAGGIHACMRAWTHPPAPPSVSDPMHGNPRTVQRPLPLGPHAWETHNYTVQRPLGPHACLHGKIEDILPCEI